MHKKQSAWSEFRQRHAIQTLGDAFGDSASTSDEFAARNLQAGVYLFENSIAIPTRFGIDASMLGSHHHDRVKGQNRFRIVQCSQAGRESIRQTFGIACELINNATRTFARENSDGVGRS